MENNVNHPQHYNTTYFECIEEMMLLFGADAVKAFCKLSAYKYKYRFANKGGEEDLAKADWYLKKLEELQKMEAEK